MSWLIFVAGIVVGIMVSFLYVNIWAIWRMRRSEHD